MAILEGVKVPTELGKLDIRITGKRPQNEPYIWIGNSETGLVVDLVDESTMRVLLRALKRALGDA